MSWKSLRFFISVNCPNPCYTYITWVAFEFIPKIKHVWHLVTRHSCCLVPSLIPWRLKTLFFIVTLSILLHFLAKCTGVKYRPKQSCLHGHWIWRFADSFWKRVWINNVSKHLTVQLLYKPATLRILGKWQFPLSWSQAIIIPIPKPGKDNTDHYRQISLSSCICKIMARD